MKLQTINILNFKNIREADLCFADKINCFIGLNGQGKTNLLDAIYYLSFTKSAFSSLDSQSISHEEQFAMIQGQYELCGEEEQISCGLKRGVKKQFRRGKKDYKRLIDHIGLLPLVMVSPGDQELILEGSDSRRKFLDGVISQYDKRYLEQLTRYGELLKQRNALLKQLDPDRPSIQMADAEAVFDVLEMQMAALDRAIFSSRTAFVEQFIPVFKEIYTSIAGKETEADVISLRYVSQLQDRDIEESLRNTRTRDIILGWTSQGIHKDELEMQLDGYPLKQVGSQGQQKTFLLALKLAQAIFLSRTAEQLGRKVLPILLLDDIFDKLDSERVARIVSLVASDRFGQIFITDTDRQHLSSLLEAHADASKIFTVVHGEIS